jgi:hypothetical protein
MRKTLSLRVCVCVCVCVCVGVGACVKFSMPISLSELIAWSLPEESLTTIQVKNHAC